MFKNEIFISDRFDTFSMDEDVSVQKVIIIN